MFGQYVLASATSPYLLVQTGDSTFTLWDIDKMEEQRSLTGSIEKISGNGEVAYIKNNQNIDIVNLYDNSIHELLYRFSLPRTLVDSLPDSIDQILWERQDFYPFEKNRQ